MPGDACKGTAEQAGSDKIIEGGHNKFQTHRTECIQYQSTLCMVDDVLRVHPKPLLKSPAGVDVAAGVAVDVPGVDVVVVPGVEVVVPGVEVVVPGVD